MRSTIAVATLVLACFVPVQVSAQSVDGAAANPTSPTNTVDFSEVAGIGTGDAAGTNWLGFGVEFSNLFWGPSAWNGSTFSTPALYNVGPSQVCCQQVFSIFFTNTVQSAVFNAVSNVFQSGLVQFRALLGGTEVHSFSNSAIIPNFGSPYNEWWWGFDGITFDEIEVTHTEEFAAFGIDNLQWTEMTTPIPEPGTLLLLGTGLVGLIGIGVVRGKNA